MAVLTYRSTELRDLSARRCWFDIVDGFWGGVEVRGVDVIIPGLAGRYSRNRLDDKRTVRLHGFVLGTDEANHRAVCDTLDGIFDPALAAGALVVTAPYMGLTAGSKTIQLRYLNADRREVVPYLVSEWDVELECIATPPDWT